MMFFVEDFLMSISIFILSARLKLLYSCSRFGLFMNIDFIFLFFTPFDFEERRHYLIEPIKIQDF